ncbi:glycosyltransferase family 4 protein [Helicobacter sp.]|uniref:glycosyltransferase family 4 protein n=1 Tax=Helicobacter sp. TaxID=218 RepID=UPI00199FE503|nr:glycosyltransferase family 4 protein [Helicobacter sp.]MBD5166149.1 glycosyltransferase family 4 protein [Helicobacter sp.]
MNLIFVRFKSSQVGGAEKYLRRLKESLISRNTTQDSGQIYSKIEVFSSGDYGQSAEMHIALPTLLPSFLKFLYFLFAYDKYHKQHRNAIYFSLERVFDCDIYRAGDGIHKEWLAIKTRNNLWLKIKSYFNPMNWIYTFIESHLFLNAKIIIANSKMIQTSLIEKFKVPPEKIRVVYNGIPLPESFDKTSAKNRLYKDFSFLKDKILLLFVGSGYARKGLQEALLMLSKIPHKNWHFLIIGKEKKQKHYEQLAKRFNILDNTLFLGAQTEVSHFYAASDIFLFPTIYEPCSNATLEAASFENAIITTKQNGAGELFNPMFLLDTPQAITQGSEILMKLLESPEFLRETQKNCAAAVSSLNVENNLQQTLQILNEIR